MASAWLIVTVLVVHVASVSAVFRPTTKDELNYAITSCISNVPSGVQCCAASPYCNAGPGTASFTDDIGDWDTSLITDMSFLFLNEASFNADISRWNTSQVTHMGYMFNGAPAFNQAIGTWDTSKVTNIYYMFEAAAAFNQALGSWNTSKVTSTNGMFLGATAWLARYNNCGYYETSYHAYCSAHAAAYVPTTSGGFQPGDGPPAA